MFSSFANLHKLLSDADQQLSSKLPESSKAIIDSRIISASLSKNKQPEDGSNIVKISFEHFMPKSESLQKVCVFWDTQDESWSDRGCQMKESNETHTQCRCQHLTHFALLALVDDPTLVGNGLDFGLIQAKDESGKVSTVITLEIATYLVSSVCLLILILLLIQVRSKFNVQMRGKKLTWLGQVMLASQMCHWDAK